MRGIKIFIYIIILLFICNININASSIKCVYGHLTVTYNTTDYKFTTNSDTNYVQYDHKLTPTNFSTGDSKLTCLDKLYIVSYKTSNKVTTFKLSVYKGDAQILNGQPYSLDLDKANSSIINDNVEPSKDEIIECKYSAGEYTASLRYNKNTKEIIKNLGNCTALNTDLKEEDFSSGNCPSARLITDAGKSGTGVYCNISNNYGTGSAPSKEADASKISSSNNTNPNRFVLPDLGKDNGFGKRASCKMTVGENGYKIINGLVNIVRVLAPIIAMLVAMITLIPAVVGKDEKKIKAATSKCVTIGIVLLIIEVVPYIVRLIGVILDFDLSCIG